MTERKKTLLKEGTIRRFMKLAELNPLAENFLDKHEPLEEEAEELEEMQEEEIEFDVIAICCDFTRYENLKEFQDSYGEEYETIEDIEEDAQVLYIEKEYCTEIHDYKLTDAFIVSNF